MFAFTLTSCGNQDHTKEYDEYFTNKSFIGQAYISKKGEIVYQKTSKKKYLKYRENPPVDFHSEILLP